MEPTNCRQCGRPNSASAKTCIWCGTPVDPASPGNFQKVRVELGYIEGIERFEDATPIHMTVDLDGVTITETMPGTRTEKIPAESIIEANVRVAGRASEEGSSKAGWWRRSSRGTRDRSYVLTIKYKILDKVGEAAFQREDDDGFAAIQSLARVIRMIVRLRGGG